MRFYNILWRNKEIFILLLGDWQVRETTKMCVTFCISNLPKVGSYTNIAPKIDVITWRKLKASTYESAT